MSLDLSNTLVIGISSTALFNLAEADKLFLDNYLKDRNSAIEVYRAYMLENEDKLLESGTGFPLVNALLKLNEHTKPGEPPIVEVVIMSRNSPETGIRILKTIRQMDINITRSAFTGGESVTDYLDAFDVDLFLTTNVNDAQKVIDSGACAVAILSPPPIKHSHPRKDQVRIAFDGDAVLFSEASEIVYKDKGIEEFHKTEDSSKDVPLDEGPYGALLKKLAKMQERLPMRVEYSPVRIAIVTARNSPAEMRVINTLRAWGVYVDEAFFLGGVGKGKVLEAFGPHIFFDDQEVHLKDAEAVVPSGRVPHQTGSLLDVVKKDRSE